MKKRIFLLQATTCKSLFVASLLFCAFAPTVLQAQALNPPGILEMPIPPAPVPPAPFCPTQSGGEYVNSASIDYSAYCAGCAAPSPQLTAVVADGGTVLPGPPEWLYVWDQVSAWQYVPIPIPQGSAPDVIIGDNVFGIGGYQYLIGVVATMPFGGPIVLFEYGVNGVGGALTVVGPISATTIYTPTTPPYPTAAHIDVIAQYSSPFPCVTCLPKCDAFAITWSDQTGNVNGYFATLSAPGTGAPVAITTTGTAYMPDVAAVERMVGLTPHNIAMFTYLDNSTSPISLNYREYDITTSTLGPIASWSNYAYSGPPRIDAIDNFTQNSTTGGNAYFDIVVSAMTGPTNPEDIIEYNNFTTGTQLAAPIITGIIPSGLVGQTNTYPTVACGPGPYYTVGYSTMPFITTYVAGWVDWSTGIPSTITNAETIPMIFPGQSIITAPLTLAATCNNDQTIGGFGPQQIFSCWNTPCGLSEKYATAPMGFKPANVKNVKLPTTWTVAPNPAKDDIFLTAAEGDIKNASYHITDMAGKEVLKGDISDLRQRIDVRSLAAGMYFINIYSGTLMLTVNKFVKE